jgi:hypothetical protein
MATGKLHVIALHRGSAALVAPPTLILHPTPSFPRTGKEWEIVPRVWVCKDVAFASLRTLAAKETLQGLSPKTSAATGSSRLSRLVQVSRQYSFKPMLFVPYVHLTHPAASISLCGPVHFVCVIMLPLLVGALHLR